MNVNPVSDIINFENDIEDAARVSNGFVLEIGVAKGDGSTSAIHNGLITHPGHLHISVDHQDYMAVAPCVSWWTLVIGDSRSLTTVIDVLNLSSGRCPGLIYIDTHHTGGQVTAELEAWSRIASRETVWLFHDTYMMGPRNDDMVDAIIRFAEKGGWVYDDFRTEPHGLGRMRHK